MLLAKGSQISTRLYPQTLHGTEEKVHLDQPTYKVIRNNEK